MKAAAALTLLAGAALGLAWIWRPRQPMAPGVRILLVCYAVLGAWALWFGLYAEPGQEPAALKFWKPTVLYWVLSGVLILAPSRGWGYPAKAVFGTYFVFSNREWHWINLGFAIFCAGLGVLNLIVAFGYTRDDWDGFRFSCMMNLLALLLLRLAFVWIDLAVRVAIHLYGRAKALFS
jgi:intracellular septation protein